MVTQNLHPDVNLRNAFSTKHSNSKTLQFIKNQKLAFFHVVLQPGLQKDNAAYETIRFYQAGLYFVKIFHGSYVFKILGYPI